jgi:hypothetical protein
VKASRMALRPGVMSGQSAVARADLLRTFRTAYL